MSNERRFQDWTRVQSTKYEGMTGVVVWDPTAHMYVVLWDGDEQEWDRYPADTNKIKEA